MIPAEAPEAPKLAVLDDPSLDARYVIAWSSTHSMLICSLRMQRNTRISKQEENVVTEEELDELLNG